MRGDVCDESGGVSEQGRWVRASLILRCLLNIQGEAGQEDT